MQSTKVQPLSDDALYIIRAGIDGYTPRGLDKEIQGDEAVEYAIGDLFLKYPREQKHMAMRALEEIAQEYVREKRNGHTT